MKQTSVYIIIALVLGLVLGYFLFGGHKTSTSNHDHNHAEEAASEQQQQKWTCSMHPQIVREEPGDCPICGMELIPMVTDASGLTAQQFKLTKNAAALANIETTEILGETGQGQHLVLSGTIAVNDDQVFTQPAHFNGRIETLYVTSVGQQVSKGQLVATVYSPELISAQQELITAYKMKGSQPELYHAVHNKFKNWMIHDSQLHEVETSGKVITQFKIYSHVSGTVTEISAKEGDHVMDGKAIFKVSNLNTVWAEFDAYENQIRSLKVGQHIAISAKAYPNTIINSEIVFIDPMLNPSTRTVNIRVVLDNSKRLFKPGMFVEGEIASQSQGVQAVLTIPASAVLWTGKRSVVYLKANPDEPVFEMREIALGNKINDTYEVLNGLAVGDIIVTHGTFTVDAAAQLQGKASMMNQNYVSIEDRSTQTSEIDVAKRITVSKAFQAEVLKIFKAYIGLKDALVESHENRAKTEATTLLHTLKNVDMKSLEQDTEAHKTYMAIHKDLEGQVKSVVNSEDITGQRKYFSEVSVSIKSMIEHFGIDRKVYVQFCPMANVNTGGYWLSFDAVIKNPYFGDAMLGCGENDKIIE
ncbi:efflux RND transporter periplasmic adaptor subunit [Formosa haliotis]|uniref:efflux RND transporter periplasmic adaptor subunit n=1 Tax=Formosa haliotis TaxID=1555194 RepID=UPI0008244CCD|nr:efflux RND transporter periplasmic adaptor subunit [Formosa haliotis]